MFGKCIAIKEHEKNNTRQCYVIGPPTVCCLGSDICLQLMIKSTHQVLARQNIAYLYALSTFGLSLKQ